MKRGLTITTLIVLILGVFLLPFLIYGFSTNWQFVRGIINTGESLDTIALHCTTACLSNSKTSFCNKERNLIIDGKETAEKETCYSLSMSKEYSGTVKKCANINCGNVGTIVGGGYSYQDSNIVITPGGVKEDVFYKMLLFLRENPTPANPLLAGTKSRSCLCETGTGPYSCNKYSEWIIKYVSELNKQKDVNSPVLDPLLILSKIMQESNCQYNSGKDSATGYYGLAQISSCEWCPVKDANLDTRNNLGCSVNNLEAIQAQSKNAGLTFLNTDYATCKNQNLFNPELNIRAAVLLLDYKRTDAIWRKSQGSDYFPSKWKYDADTWESALRGFVGWDLSQHETYVDEIVYRYQKLKELYSTCAKGDCKLSS